MPNDLERIETATLTVPIPDWAHRCMYNGALCRLVVFPASTEHVLVRNHRTLSALRRLPVPATASHLAVHPQLTHLASLTGQKLLIHDENGTLLRQTEFSTQEGEPKAVAFDYSGAVLFVSVEAPDKGDAIDHVLYALEAVNLNRIATATIAGDVGAVHHLSIHPSEPAIAFQVGCGQDGCWTNLYRLDGKELMFWTSIDPKDDYAPLVFFSPDGKYFAGLYREKIQLWEWPSLKLVAQDDVEEDKFFTDAIGYRDDRMIVIIDDNNAGFAIEERSLPKLEVIASAELSLPENVRGFEVLGGDLLSSHYVTHKKRISPADCTPESETFQIWRLQR